MNNSFTKTILSSRNILILAIVTIGLIPELLSAGGFYIRGDVTSQMLPFVYETKRMFSSGVPFWSWNTYFGDNFIASYAYYTVFNPFTWINCLFPYKYLGVGFTLVLYLKFLVCGYVAQRYLKKIGFDEKLSLIGSILYTFSSWAISNLCFYMFLEPMIVFPFMLIFVERLLARDKYCYSGLVMSTFVAVVVNYYFAVANLISVGIYFLCRVIFLYKERRERVSIAFKAIGCVALGILCSSFVLIPVAYQLMGTSRFSSGDIPFDFTMLFYRLFWLIYPKAHEGRFHYLFYNECWGSNAAGIAVFGILPTILLFVRKGPLWLKWLTGIMVVCYLTPLTGLFFLFTDIHYTRWAYALTLSLILCTLFYIKDYGLPRFKYAVIYCLIVYTAYLIFAGASMYWKYTYDGGPGFSGIRMLSTDVILVVANAFGLLFICFRKRDKHNITLSDVIVISTCTGLQFFIFSEPQITTPSPSIQAISETEYFWQHENFRTDQDISYRTDFRVYNPGGTHACNYGLICNRPSVSTYHSIQNRKINTWNNIVGVSDLRRVFFPDKHVESFDALMSVKDVVNVYNGIADNESENPIRNRKMNFDVAVSEHFIPMGFAYDQYVTTDSIIKIAQNDDTIDIPKILLSAIAIDKEDEREISKYLKKGVIDWQLGLDSLVSVRKKIACDRFTGHTQGFDAHIDLDSAAIVFFSVVADKGFSAYIDGKTSKIYETNLGFSSVIVPAGSHDISFRYFTPGLKLGLIISLIGFVITGFLFYKDL